MDTTPQQLDPRPMLSESMSIVTTTIDAISPSDLERPTPCPDWTVRELAAHIVGVARRIEAVGDGRPAMSVPIVVDDIADDAIGHEWRTASDRALAAWADDAKLGQIVSPPFGDMPGGAALGIYVSEITVHTWDLATAIGHEPAWNQEIAAACLAGIEDKLPATGRGDEMPFTDATPVGDDASAVVRLAAFCGRPVT